MTEFVALLTVGEHWLLITLVALVMLGACVGEGVAQKRRAARQPVDLSEVPLTALPPLAPMEDPADCVCTQADAG